MAPAGNDRWLGEFVAGAAGRYRYTVCAWVDHFLSWRTEFARREDPADIVIAARVGAQLASEAAERAKGSDRTQLRRQAKLLESEDDIASLRVAALDEAFKALAMRYPDRSLQTDWPVEMPLRVDRARARFSSWYELFPRSASAEPGRHGTLRDCEARLPYVAELGFDVLYLPPIHPIGRIRRKGPQQHAGRRAGRCRQPLGDRVRRGRAQGGAPGAGHHRRFPRPGRARRRARHRDRARHRLPVRAGPPLRQGAPRLVPPAPGRQRPVRGEPAQEVPGHLPVRLRVRGLARTLEGTAQRVRVLDRRGRAHLPRRQSAHQGLPVLGVGDRRPHARASRPDLPGRGVHAAQGDAPARQARLHPVLHLLHLAQHAARSSPST